MLLLDASNSMNSNFDGAHRLQAAKKAISETVPRYDTQLDIGMVTFGSRQRQSCGDVTSLVAPGPGNASKLVIAANGVKAQGVSLLAEGLQRAADDADFRSKPTSIIALVDGAGVNVCQVNACTVATELKRQAPNLSIHVIALSPKPAEVPALECVASATGGTYVATANSRQVRNALDLAFLATVNKASAVSAAPAPKRKPKPPVLADNAPPPRAKPDAGNAGITALAANDRGTAPDEPGTAQRAIDDTVSVFAPTRPGGAAPAPGLAAQPPAGPQNQPGAAAGNQLVMAPTVRQPTAPTAARPGANAGGGSRIAAVTPGTTTLYKRPPPARTAPGVKAPEPEIPPAANQNTAAPSAASPGLTMVPASEAANTVAAAPPPARTPDPAPTPAAEQGAVRLSAVIVADAKPVPEGMLWQIYKEAENGARGPLATRSSDPTPVLKLPAGRYLVEGRFGNALRDMPVQIKAGEETEARLVLNVGGLQLVPAVAGVADPDADITNTIYAAGDPQNPVVANAVAGAVIYLSAGRYRIVSRYGNANSIAEDDIQVQRGKLTQAKINHRAAPVRFRLVGSAGGEPLSGTSWVITDQAGRTVKQTDEATPTYILAEGSYQIAVTRGERTFSKTVAVEQGVAATVEILAQ